MESNKQKLIAKFAKKFAYKEAKTEFSILAGCPAGGGVVLDPFGGSGTTKEVANKNNRECILIELNPEYIELAEKRTEHIQPVLNLEG